MSPLKPKAIAVKNAFREVRILKGVLETPFTNTLAKKD